MQVHITARHINLTEAIGDYLNKKVNKLERHFDHLVWANAILWVEKHRHLAELVIHSPLHTLRAKEEAADLYAAIDLVVEKIEKQLKKIKEKRSSDKRPWARRVNVGGAGFSYSGGADLSGTLYGGDRQDPRDSSQWPASISVVKQVPVKPMGVEEAIRTMDSLGYNFWMFFNKGAKRINVIFRRSDQTYGILEPSRK